MERRLSADEDFSLWDDLGKGGKRNGQRESRHGPIGQRTARSSPRPAAPVCPPWAAASDLEAKVLTPAPGRCVCSRASPRYAPERSLLYPVNDSPNGPVAIAQRLLVGDGPLDFPAPPVPPRQGHVALESNHVIPRLPCDHVTDDTPSLRPAPRKHSTHHLFATSSTFSTLHPLPSMTSYPPPPRKLAEQPDIASARTAAPMPPPLPSRAERTAAEQADAGAEHAEDDGLDVISYWAIGTGVWWVLRACRHEEEFR